MNKKLLLMLKTLFASKGFSAKALEGLAEYIAPNLTEESTDEEITAAIEAVKPMTDIMQSEINRQVNDAKKPKSGDPKPEPTPEPDANPNPNDPNAELLAMLKEVKGELAAIKGEKVTITRKDQVTKMLEGSDDKFKAATLKAFGRMQFKDDEEFTEYLSELETDAKEFVKADASEQVGGWKPEGGAGGNVSKIKEASAAELDAATKNFKI